MQCMNNGDFLNCPDCLSAIDDRKLRNTEFAENFRGSLL
jgi:hypothetical protein